jgi:ribosomal protein S4E
MDLEQSAGLLELARKHVREGEERVRRQQALVERLRAGGHDMREALALLATLQDTLALMYADLERQVLRHRELEAGRR